MTRALLFPVGEHHGVRTEPCCAEEVEIIPAQARAHTFTQLATLVSERREALGKSYRTLAAETGVSLTSIHKIAHGNITRAPTPDVIDALAKGLQLPRQALLQAAAADIGLREITVEQDDLRAVVLAYAPLSAEDRAVILTLMHKLGAASTGHAEPV